MVFLSKKEIKYILDFLTLEYYEIDYNTELTEKIKAKLRKALN